MLCQRDDAPTLFFCDRPWAHREVETVAYKIHTAVSRDVCQRASKPEIAG